MNKLNAVITDRYYRALRDVYVKTQKGEDFSFSSVSRSFKVPTSFKTILLRQGIIKKSEDNPSRYTWLIPGNPAFYSIAEKVHTIQNIEYTDSKRKSRERLGLIKPPREKRTKTIKGERSEEKTINKYSLVIEKIHSLIKDRLPINFTKFRDQEKVNKSLPSIMEEVGIIKRRSPSRWEWLVGDNLSYTDLSTLVCQEARKRVSTSALKKDNSIPYQPLPRVVTYVKSKNLEELPEILKKKEELLQDTSEQKVQGLDQSLKKIKLGSTSESTLKKRVLLLKEVYSICSKGQVLDINEIKSRLNIKVDGSFKGYLVRLGIINPASQKGVYKWSENSGSNFEDLAKKYSDFSNQKIYESLVRKTIEKSEGNYSPRRRKNTPPTQLEQEEIVETKSPVVEESLPLFHIRELKTTLLSSEDKIDLLLFLNEVARDVNYQIFLPKISSLIQKLKKELS